MRAGRPLELLAQVKLPKSMRDFHRQRYDFCIRRRMDPPPGSTAPVLRS